MKKKFDFAKAMKELEEINQWFQEEEIDLDVGLEKLKRGKELISACRERLKDVENEFIQIRDADAPARRAAAPQETVEKPEGKLVDTLDDEADADDLPF